MKIQRKPTENQRKAYRCIVERLGDEEVVVFWIAAELLVDGVIENPLHTVPVVNDSVLDWILGKIVAVAKSILSHTIVQIFQSLERSIRAFLVD